MSKIQNTPPELQATTEMILFFERMKARLDNAAVADPTGGGTVDTECRAQLVALLNAFRASLLIDT